jgi:hypothetical protein
VIPDRPRTHPGDAVCLKPSAVAWALAARSSEDTCHRERPVERDLRAVDPAGRGRFLPAGVGACDRPEELIELLAG